MNNFIPILLAVEDALSEAVIKHIVISTARPYAIGECYRRNGKSYLQKGIRGFNNAAKGTPFLVLTDLDTIECPPRLIYDWLPYPKHPNLLFRVAVREVEAWLMAHRQALATFFGVNLNIIPTNVEHLDDPKRALINIARRSKYSVIRNDIVPSSSTARIGPNYNGRLMHYVISSWQPQVARQFSPSLDRTIIALETFLPSYGSA